MSIRDKYYGWHLKTPAELSELWARAIFVADANVLLHCIRHPAAVRNELLRLFEALEASLWIPYQVGLEFHRNRLDVELGAQDVYEVLTKDMEAILEKGRERLRQLRAHPTISVAKELAALEIFAADFRGRMTAAEVAHPTKEIESAVSKLMTLLGDRVGDKWTREQLSSLKKEGEDRYTRKIPPGYKDAKKDAGELDKFGDLIIWKEMITKAKVENRPIVFITDDVKEDWWWIHKGRKLGPRPELIEEFKTESGQDFHIYEFSQFLRIAAERFASIKENVGKVEESLLADEKARQRQNDAADAMEHDARLRHLEDERDEIIAYLSGAPGASLITTNNDRTKLRTRLKEIDELIIKNSKTAQSPPDI